MAATLAARRWGDRIRGIVVAVPVVAGPILLILGVEHGQAFVDRAAHAALFWIIAVWAYCLVVDRTLRRGTRRGRGGSPGVVIGREPL